MRKCELLTRKDRDEDEAKFVERINELMLKNHSVQLLSGGWNQYGRLISVLIQYETDPP